MKVGENLNWISLIVFTIISILAVIFIMLILDIKENRYLTLRIRKAPQPEKENFISKFIKLSKKTEEDLEKKLSSVGLSLTPRQFMLRKIIQGVTVFLLISFIGILVYNDILVYLLAGVAGVYAFQQPTRTLNQRIAGNIIQKKLDFPQYLKVLTTLMRTHSGYNAIKESIKYAPESIKHYVEDLLLEISMYPKQFEPYQNFAQKIGIDEAKQYMIVLYQAIEISERNSQEFLERLEMLNTQLENQANELAKDIEQNQMGKYVYILITSMIVLPLGIAFVTMFKIFSEFSS
jgi:hypothetical protein